MSDNNRTCSNEAMEKMIGNVTAELQNTDGQYINLGFTPPSTPPEQLNWSQQPSYMNHYNAGVEQYPQQPFNFMPPHPQMFDQNGYKKNFNNLSEYDMYKMRQNGAADIGRFERDYYVPQMLNNIPLQPHQDAVPLSSTRGQLFDLVGNWIGPTINGTYSPFGTSENYPPNPNVFDLQQDLTNANIIHQLGEEPKFATADHLEDVQFQFNRDMRKPRMVAEVKPMRPSYSDVLTKPVPQTTSKPLKSDAKESKPKKEGKRSTKNEKGQKAGSTLNRSNTNNDIKDISADKISNQTKDKSKTHKGGQMNRKWASLDDITDPQVGKSDDVKKRKVEGKDSNKLNARKMNKTVNDIGDIETDNTRSETINVTKNGLKKINKPMARPKLYDFGGSEKPPGKRNQRTRKRENHVPFGIVGQKVKLYTKGWWKIFTVFLLWLFHLISDICHLSLHISRDMAAISWTWICINCALLVNSTNSFIQGIPLVEWTINKFKGRKKESTDSQNINMPTTGEEAMKRLLACKGKDPYSILGVSPNCTDDDIKRYYKRQAFLVHPDKNNQVGAEEAFKILSHAFNLIGDPEQRTSYDRGVVQSAQVAQAWSELTELLQQFQQKVETAANTIRCSSCGFKHKRVRIDRPSYAARNCNTCKIHHSAREGDIWAEARVLGFLWHYYACMEGAVYDITEWARCQKGSMKQLKPDSHHVQYRISLGKHNQPRRHTPTLHPGRPDLENLLNSFYGQTEGAQGTRRRNKKGYK
ncbi:uncharacterized protein [Leptinotarsa decemlineata]|uniref:uncharacterized protein n=1 Tax=Leptinotarsa decemlineata TaxID=7539 RepID=UPI003D30D0C2